MCIPYLAFFSSSFLSAQSPWVSAEPDNELGYGRGFPATASPQGGGIYRATLIIISKTPELKKLGTWELVADALKKTPLGPVRDGFVLPVLPQEISTVVFSFKKF